MLTFPSGPMVQWNGSLRSNSAQYISVIHIVCYITDAKPCCLTGVLLIILFISHQHDQTGSATEFRQKKCGGVKSELHACVEIAQPSSFDTRLLALSWFHAVSERYVVWCVSAHVEDIWRYRMIKTVSEDKALMFLQSYRSCGFIIVPAGRFFSCM